MTAYQVGVQLATDAGSRSATDPAFDRLVRELAGHGLEADWRGLPKEGRVELVGTVEADDAEAALARTTAALRAVAAAMGPALPGFALRSLAAQPLDNPVDWVAPNGAAPA